MYNLWTANLVENIVLSVFWLLIAASIHIVLKKFLREALNCERDSGWQSIREDVFRPPTNRVLLSALLGSGTQVLCTAVAMHLIVILGFLSAANRNQMIVTAIYVYISFAPIGGYAATCIDCSADGAKWKSNALLTSLLCPGILLTLIVSVEALLWTNGDPNNISIYTWFRIIVVWLLIMTPFVFVGAFLGVTQSTFKPQQTSISEVPRPIPGHAVHENTIIAIVLGGAMSCIYIIIHYFCILNAINTNRMENMHNYLFAVFWILATMSPQIAVILCYLHLCEQDYRWWWRPFLTSACTALFLLLFCGCVLGKPNTDNVISICIHFGYIFIILFLVFLLVGTVGFYACLGFVRKIYAATSDESIQCKVKHLKSERTTKV